MMKINKPYKDYLLVRKQVDRTNKLTDGEYKGVVEVLQRGYNADSKIKVGDKLLVNPLAGTEFCEDKDLVFIFENQVLAWV